MPSALTFKDQDHLVAALKQVQWERRLDEIHAERDDLGPLTSIFAAVSSSTFRAFKSRGEKRPSVVFRNCVSELLCNCGVSDLANAGSNDDYRAWALRFARHLEKRWNEQLRYSLDRPRALKLVNLLAKGLCTVSPIWPDRSKTVARYIDVPLDQFSLRPLACIDKWRGLRNASMGDVNNQYEEIQATIRELCKAAGKPPIAYDFLMWDGAHKKKNQKRSEC
jgi:hypothetical protein